MPVRLDLNWLGISSALDKPCDDDESWQIFDCAEKGLMRSEAPAALSRPFSQSRCLERFLVVRSAGCQRYHLFSDNGDALMTAGFNTTESKVEFLVYNASEKTYESSPTFSMAYNRNKSTWLLVQEQCRSCPNSPSSPLTPSTPSPTQPQQLALFRHFCKDVGDGLARCMEVTLPTYQEGLWRRHSVQIDLRRGRGVAEHLVTRLPDWDPAEQSLTLDFDGRFLQGSAKNFQLALEHASTEAVFQYGKIGANTFCLDFKAPLSIVQAFAASISAAYWT